MKKTLTTELIMTILLVVLGVLGFYFLGGAVKEWVMPVLTAIILLAYLVRWQFVLSAGILMSMITTLIMLHNSFSLGHTIIEVVTLTAIGLLICFSYQYWKWEAHSSLVFGIVLGNVIGGIAAWVLHTVFSIGSFGNLYQYTCNALVDNIKGIAILLAVVPLLVKFVFRKIYKTGRHK